MVDAYAAVGDGTLFLAGVGDDDSDVVALDAASGRERWTFGADGMIEAAPVLVEGTLVVTSDDDGLFGSGHPWLGAGGNVDALDAVAGDRRWRIELGFGRAAPAVADGTLYVAVLPGAGGRGATLSAYGDG